MHSPPGTVFDFVAAHHFENHPRWDPDVLEMNQTSPGNSWPRHKRPILCAGKAAAGWREPQL